MQDQSLSSSSPSSFSFSSPSSSNSQRVECSQHSGHHINYIFQREGELLQLGCLECVKQGALFFDSSHFLNEVQDVLDRRVLSKRRLDYHYKEINQLLQLTKDKLYKDGNDNEFLAILSELIDFFEIDEESYQLNICHNHKQIQSKKIQSLNNTYDGTTATTSNDNQDEEVSFCYEGIKSDDEDGEEDESEDYDQSFQEYQQLEKYERYISSDWFDEGKLLFKEQGMSLQQQFVNGIKKIRKEAIEKSFQTCQNVNSSMYMNADTPWIQFKYFARRYIYPSTKQYYHIYKEDKYKLKLSNVCHEYERIYNPIKTIDFDKQKFQSQGQQQLQESQQQYQYQQKQEQDNQFCMPDLSQLDCEQDRYFHECQECSNVIKQADAQSLLLYQLLTELNNILGFKKLCEPYLTFCPLRIFWDLRID